MSVPQVVLVNFQFEYTARDGKQVSIKPNERYVLVAKTNEHWWHVRKDEATKPFFIPAMYVTELPSEGSWTFPEPPVVEGEQEPPKPETVPADTQVTIRNLTSIKRDSEKDGHRISTFIIPQDLYDVKLFEAETEPDPIPRDLYKNVAQMDGTTSSSPLAEESTYGLSLTHFANEPVSASPEMLPPKSPSSDINKEIAMLRRAGWDMQIWDLMEDGIYESINDAKDNEAEPPPPAPSPPAPSPPAPSPPAPSTPASVKEQTPEFPTVLPDGIPAKRKVKKQER